MIRLSDLVGAILQEMAIARTQATLFAAQMAADFRDHEILSQIAIPNYRVSAAEFCVPFAVARVSTGREAMTVSLDPADIAQMAQSVAVALPQEGPLEAAFSLYDSQAEKWRSDIAPMIAERTAADTAAIQSIDGIGTTYGYVAKTLYLLSLIPRQREVSRAALRDSVEAGYADLLEDTARRLLEDELERTLGDRVELGLYIHIERDDLKATDHISSLKIELEEGTLDRIALMESGKVDRE